MEGGARLAALRSVLDGPIYSDQRPLLTGDLAFATRPRQRFAVGFSDVTPSVEHFAGGQRDGPPRSHCSFPIKAALLLRRYRTLLMRIHLKIVGSDVQGFIGEGAHLARLRAP